jgi:hypothetical protein
MSSVRPVLAVEGAQLLDEAIAPHGVRDVHGPAAQRAAKPYARVALSSTLGSPSR